MNLSERAKVFRNEKNNFVKEIIDYVKNSNHSLEDRWQLFKESNDLLPRCSWMVFIHEIEINGGNFYDDFGYDRHQTVDMADIVDMIEDNPLKYSKFNADKVKEQILESGYGSFIFDW